MKQRILSHILAATAIFVQIGLSACDGPIGGGRLAEPIGGIPPETSGQTTAEYRLGTGDKVRVVVFNEPSLSGEFQVDDSGTMSMPLVGTLKVAGLTTRDVEKQLTQKLRGGFVRDPKVSAEVANYRPFYVIGEVEKPGEFPYRNGLSILAAGAIAGGFTYRASRSKVFIKRAAEAFEREMPLSPATLILPGDVIRVPERYF